MIEFFANLFSVDGFPPRWHCGSWTDFHGWLYIVSDLGVWAAYTAIPAVLVYFVWQKATIPFRRIFWLFGAFILACGLTHLFDAIMFWWPAYRFLGLLEFFTAVVSWATVVALVPIVPQALALRSPQELQREIDARRKAEADLQQVNHELEGRIQERTAELVQINATLKREREWFQTTLVSIGDAVIATDTEGRITFINKVAQSLTGWTERDARHESLDVVFKIVNETTHESAPNPAIRALKEGGIVGLANHTLLISKSGREIPIDDSAAPIRDEDQNVEGVVLVFRDVTQRRKAEGSLRFLADASTTLSSLTDQKNTLQKLARLSIPFFADWCVVYLAKDAQVIERAALAHGDPAKEALLDELQARFPLQWDSPAPSAGVIRTGQSDLTASISPEYLRHAASSDEHYALLTRINPRSHVFVPLVIRDKVIGAIGFMISESDRQYTAADLVLAQELARRAAVALENAGLYQELRTADRRKDEFLAMLAHELRNPLAPIRNALELLKIDTDPQTASWAHQIMQRQVEHIVHLVDDLLDVSRIMQGKIQLKKQPTELGAAVHHALEESKPDFKAQEQQLSLSLPTDEVWLNADPTRLSQIISNLLSNASKYTDGGGKISLEAEAHDGKVTLRVRDSGIGIPQDMLQQIFVPFTQLSSSVDRARGGLGIGLSLVRSLVEMHGGTVIAHSEGLGQGSVFTVEIPTIPGRPAHTKSRWTPSPVIARRVLVVDDNHGAAQTLTLLLKRLWNHEVETVNDGLAGLEKVSGFRPDVVLLDIGLPGMSGYEVAKQIRQLSEGRSLLLVALTGYGQEEDRRKSTAAGFDLHLVKPVTAETIQEVFKHPKLDGR